MHTNSESHEPRIPLTVPQLVEERMRLARSIRARNTLSAYASDWRLFAHWCASRGLVSLPATTDTAALYLTDLLNEGAKTTTASRRITSITYAHITAGLPTPCNRETRAIVKGARRLRCEQPSQKTPVIVSRLKAMLEALPGDDIIAIRNRSILLLGFASALRRSNLAALEMTDLEFSKAGVLLRIRHEKQDRKGTGRTVPIPNGEQPWTCPVLALRRWLEHRGGAGFVFTRVRQGRATEARLHPNWIAEIVKQAAAGIALDPKTFGAHSLRSGFVTEALERGVNEIAIANHTGHRSLSSLRRYFRPTDPFRSNACGALGL